MGFFYCFHLERININHLLCLNTLLGINEQFTSASKTVMPYECTRDSQPFIWRKMKEQNSLDWKNISFPESHRLESERIENRWQQIFSDESSFMSTSCIPSPGRQHPQIKDQFQVQLHWRFTLDKGCLCRWQGLPISSLKYSLELYIQNKQKKYRTIIC